MSDEQLSEADGQAVENGMCGRTRIFNHHWENPRTHLPKSAQSPPAKSREVSGGLLSEAITVKINKLIFEYDQVLICGPVFPHEVVGFSGGNKYFSPASAARK